MKNDYKTFDSIMKGIEKQAIAEVGKYLRTTNNDLIVGNKHIFYDFDLEIIVGANCKELVKIYDSLFNTEVYPYYELAEDNLKRSISSVLSLIKRKYGGYFLFKQPFKVSYRSNTNWNGTATIDMVKYDKFWDDENLLTINTENGKEFPIRPEDYYTVLEHIYAETND